MTMWANLGGNAPRRLLTAALVVVLVLAGCSKQAGPEETAKKQPGAELAATTAKDSAGEPLAAADLSGQNLGPAPMDAWHQPFALATRSSDNPPEGAERPPD